MQKLDISKVPKKLKPNPLFKGMSDFLKDPKNFKATEKKLKSILKTSHEHKTVSSYAKCSLCQSRREERKKQMKALGFKGIGQYMEWKKIQTIIAEKKSFELK